MSSRETVLGRIRSALAADMVKNFDDYVDYFWLVKPKAAKLDSLLKD